MPACRKQSKSAPAGAAAVLPYGRSAADARWNSAYNRNCARERRKSAAVGARRGSLRIRRAATRYQAFNMNCAWERGQSTAAGARWGSRRRRRRAAASRERCWKGVECAAACLPRARRLRGQGLRRRLRGVGAREGRKAGACMPGSRQRRRGWLRGQVQRAGRPLRRGKLPRRRWLPHNRNLQAA